MKKKRLWKKVIAAVCTVTMLPLGGNFGTVQAATEPETKVQAETMNETMKLWYKTPGNINTGGGASAQWVTEALPLGNGNLGNLVFGGITKERVHFNEKSLWDSTTTEGGNRDTAYTDEEIEQYRLEMDDKSKEVFPHGMDDTRFRGADARKGSYQDFGDIWLDYSPMKIDESAVTNYRRELNIQTGIASTEFDYKNVSYKREHFVSAPDNVMVTRMTASKKGKLSVDISMTLNNSGLAGVTSLDEKNHTYTIDGNVKANGLKFRTTMQVVPVGGTITADTEENVYHVEDADSIMIVMAEETNYVNNYPNYLDTEKDLAGIVDGRTLKCGAMDYKELKERHVADHQGLFDRVSLDLGERLPNIPTNELVDAYRSGEYSTYLEVLSFQYGRYLSIAGSRGDLPSNLNGMWTIGASGWSGDYHFNVNVQMNYWPVYVTNLAECGKTFVEYMDNLRAPGRVTAERIHGIENATTEHTGFTVHVGNSPFGQTTPDVPHDYGWNPTGAAWAIQNIWQDYEFTQDIDYLKNKIYPIMKEAALFWDNYLWESHYQKIDDPSSPHNGENRLVVAPGYSAEQGPTANGTTYDQSLVWELYKECIEAGKLVGEDQAQLDKWQDEMDRLDPININATGGIKEWYEETRVGIGSTGHNQSFAQAGDLPEIEVPNSGWNHGHPGEQRHASHLVGLYPGTLINKENQEYMDAAIQSLNERGFYSTGWSKANKVNLWARTGNGDNAYKVLNNLIGGKSAGLQYNLLDSHGSGGGDTMLNGTPVFQIDGNYGLTAGVAEMLVQSQLGYTQFLPAIPEAWQNGEVQGLKARGNFTIGEKWQNGLADSFTVCYEGGEESSTFIGEYEGITNAKVYADGEEITVTKDEEKGQISFDAVKGRTYTIDLSEENADELIEKAAAFLDQIHPDLVKAKEELQKAIDEKASDLGDVFAKVQMMDKTYRRYLPYKDNIYYMTKLEGLTDAEIDSMYVEMRQIAAALLNNTEDSSYYENAFASINEIGKTLNSQMDSRVITFSVESGTLTDDTTLTLSKPEGASGYDIRYTTDGSTPWADSPLYADGIDLKVADGNKTVKAALFYKYQRVSPVYSEKYVTEGIKVNGVDVSFKDTWGASYVETNMIDGNPATRWAVRDTSDPIDVVIDFDESTIDTVNFDFYVSSYNSIGAFEIQAKNADGEFETVFESDEMGDYDDRVTSKPDGNGEGYHAYFTAKFPEVKTSQVKIVLKSFTKGPSFYEVQPVYFGAEEEITAGDASDLKEMIRLAEQVDRDSEDYKNADAALKAAFEESILDAKETENLTQEKLDSKEAFLRNRYERLGYGEVDKGELTGLVEQAKLMLDGEYTRSSIYLLNKAINNAQAVLDNDSAKITDVDNAAAELKKAMSDMEPIVDEVLEDIPSGSLSGDWIEAAGGFRATNSDNVPLSYDFSGIGIVVKTVTAPDHGNLMVKITNTVTDEVVYEETFNTYAAERTDGALLFDKDLENSNYRIEFERNGYTAPANNGWVEVKLTVKRSGEEVVDRSYLQEEIEKCQNLAAGDYTEASWNRLQEILKQAEEVLKKDDKDTSTAEMDDFAAQIEEARDALVELSDVIAGVDPIKPVTVSIGTTAEELLAKLPNEVTLTMGDERKETAGVAWDVADFDGTKAGTMTIEGTVDLSSIENAVDDDLKVTVEVTVEEVSKNTLKRFLDKAQGYVDDGTVAGLKESVQKLFAEAIEEGNAVYANPNATKEEVMNAAFKLMKAIHALDFVAADKTDLEMAINLAEMIDLADYVTAGQEEFKAALKEAQDVFNDGDAFQDDVDKAYNNLLDTMVNLRLKADKSVLDELLKEFADVDLDKYTKESAAAYKAALAAANDVMTNDELSEDDQAVVDKAAKELQDAYDALQLKSDNNNSGNTGDDNNSGNTGGDNNSGNSGNNSNGGNVSSGSDAPKTGDAADFAPWAVCLVLAAGASVVTLKTKKKN